MEGKRFSVGLVGGLLFALVIVVGSGLFASGPSGTFFAGSQVVQTSTPTTVSTTNTSASPALGVTIATSTYAHFPSGNTTGIKAANTPSSPQFSSDLATAGQLPTSSRALLLAPIVVAALLGVLIHRASRNSGESEED